MHSSKNYKGSHDYRYYQYVVYWVIAIFHQQLNSSSCKASCRGLTHIRNLSSIFNGDGSTSPTPGIPTVTNKTFTSVSLKWDPVRNATGTAVYLIAMYITGDKVLNLPHYFVQVGSNVPLVKKYECFALICLKNHYGPQPILTNCLVVCG